MWAPSSSGSGLALQGSRSFHTSVDGDQTEPRAQAKPPPPPSGRISQLKRLRLATPPLRTGWSSRWDSRSGFLITVQRCSKLVVALYLNRGSCFPLFDSFLGLRLSGPRQDAFISMLAPTGRRTNPPAYFFFACLILYVDRLFLLYAV